MKRFILTGTPGCGKTSILHALEARGYAVVGEAATDLIAMDQAQGCRSPWTKAGFIERVVALQKQRQLRASGEVAFFDRSPICTYALAIYLGVSPPPPLVLELERLRDQRIYDSEVFFIRNLGFCEPTPARQMTYSDSLLFEKIHQEAYVELGYTCVPVEPAPLCVRVEAILARLAGTGT